MKGTSDKISLPKLSVIKRTITLNDSLTEVKDLLEKLKTEKADKVTVEQEGKFILEQIENLKSWLVKLDDITSMKLTLQQLS